MFRSITVLGLVLLMFSFGLVANAAMVASGNVAPIQNGQNVLAGSAHNDSPGSSDLTLIVQLMADGGILVDEGDACKVIMPTANIPSNADPTGWTQYGFDASAWADGTNGVGYGDGDDNTTIGDGNNATVYMVIPFTIADANTISSLVLGVDYDDACVIYINGVEVARTSGTDIGIPAEYDDWSDQGSGQSHEASKADPPNYETLDIAFDVTTAVEPGGKLAILWSDLKR